MQKYILTVICKPYLRRHHHPMKRLILIALLVGPFWTLGQGTSQKPLPEFMYITRHMAKSQVDSIKTVLGKHDVTLSIDSLVYDDNKKIKIISGSLNSYDEIYPFSTTNFKGMTIISRGDSLTLIMGILPAPKKK